MPHGLTQPCHEGDVTFVKSHHLCWSWSNDFYYAWGSCGTLPPSRVLITECHNSHKLSQSFLNTRTEIGRTELLICFLATSQLCWSNVRHWKNCVQIFLAKNHKCSQFRSQHTFTDSKSCFSTKHDLVNMIFIYCIWTYPGQQYRFVFLLNLF